MRPGFGVTKYDVDYLVIGAGAMGMAFTDTILNESDATVALVDRRPRPGGHWNDAYPHVRLHQPSAFYGVNSRELGTDAIDTHGWNEGLSELASGTEVVAYFDQVLRQQFLGSGRVQWFPMTAYESGGVMRSVVTGETTTVTARTVVNAGYMNVTVPSTRPPRYEVDPEAICIPPNDLGKPGVLSGGNVVIIGSGKTGMDACLFVLESGLAPERITWIRPRDQWCLDRARIQPGIEFSEGLAMNRAQLEAIAASESIDDLFDRLETEGVLIRFDPSIAPTMYRCATVSIRELQAMRTVTNVVRMGHVQRIGMDEIVLDDGTIPTAPGTVHIDCTADGLERRPVVPVFGDGTITLQTVRFCQQVFSAAFIAHVDVAYDDEGKKNELATVVPHPDTHVDWIRTTLSHMMATNRWSADAALTEWLMDARLDFFSSRRSTELAARAEEHFAEMKDIASTAAMKLMGYLEQIET